jgi:hypothetical protein
MALSTFLLVTPLFAQEPTYRDAYLSHVEGEVSLQRASEPEPESGSLNVPILPGDRIWTRAGSRVEIRFGSGLIVHLSEGAKLDFVARDAETILRLWSGSAILILPESPEALRVDSPAGSVRPSRAGTYRIDIRENDAMTLVVERGSAELASSLGTVRVQSGEMSFATPSNAPTIPAQFNTAELDDFDRWSESRVASRARTRDIVVRSLPHAVQSHVYELSYHGDWDHEPDYGYVWYPRVEVGWAPYTYGYWRYMPYGHTWISSEPWGWAPYHYGRWGFGHRGWYWIPGAAWGPAWVSFAIGPAWVGWSPLGYYGGPVFGFHTYYGGYPWSYTPRGGRHGGGWNVCSRDDFDRGVVTRAGYRRLEPNAVRASVGSARFVDEASALDRNLDSRGSSAVETADSMNPAVRRGVDRPTKPSSTEEVLRGFRERASGRSAFTRSASEITRRARELPSEPRTRETATREPRELGRPWRSDTSQETARSEVRTPARRTEVRDRLGRERDSTIPSAPPAETRSRVSRSPRRGDVEVRRSPSTGERARETRSESTGRAEPSEAGRGGTVFRERSSPGPSSTSTQSQAGGARRARGSDGRASSQGRAARPRGR